MCQRFTTFPQRCGNVFATFEDDVDATSGGNILTTVAQHLSNVPGLRCSNVSRNIAITFAQRCGNARVTFLESVDAM